MQIIRDIFRNAAIPFLVCIVFGLLDLAPLRDRVASFFVRSEFVSDEQAIAQSIENCKSSVRSQAIIEWRTRYYDPSWNLENCENVKNKGQAIVEGRNNLIAHMRQESLYGISNRIREFSNVVLAVTLALMLILILRNTHVYILRGRYGINLFDIPRIPVSSLRSRAAEMELLRYKKLFDNGLISEEEFAEKKKKLKPAILNSR